MKPFFRTRPKWYLGAALILAGFLIGGYCAIMSTHVRQPGETVSGRTNVSAEPEVDEPDSYVAGAGPKSVSSEDLAKVRAVARALPHSPFMHGRKFNAAEGPSAAAPYTSWTAPIPPPLADVYHANVKNSGRVWTFGFDPSNGNVVYAGGFGGVLKTTNANSPNPTWQVHFRFLGVTGDRLCCGRPQCGQLCLCRDQQRLCTL